jgi:hypothetical protein
MLYSVFSTVVRIVANENGTQTFLIEESYKSQNFLNQKSYLSGSYQQQLAFRKPVIILRLNMYLHYKPLLYYSSRDTMACVVNEQNYSSPFLTSMTF